MGLLVPLAVVRQSADVTLEVDLLFGVVAVSHRKLTLLFAHSLREIVLTTLQLLRLLLYDLELGIEHKLLPFDLKALFCHLLKISIEVAPHLRILVFQEADVLVRGLIVIVEAANARLLLILDHFFPQNFEFQLHEVDLLLQVDDVVICGVDVGVLPKLAGSLLLLLLATEVHCDG